MNQFYKLLFIVLLIVSTNNFAQRELLQSGPMAGATDMREAKLWLQTKESAAVKIVYWDKENPAEKFSTNTVQTEESAAFTAHLTADKVEPGKKYAYSVFINDQEISFDYLLEFQTLKLWQWRENAPDFNFVIGSCAYINEPQYDRPGKPYGGDYQIFKSIYEKHPDFMIWMGDNTYLREPDWNTRTGILNRYTHTRSLPELQPLLASTHHYATWDDHDFGPNDSDRGYPFKELTLDAFKLFWANPFYGVNGKPGVTTKFEWADVEFFLLDDRYNRSPNNRKTGEREMFGDEQIQWLIDALASSKAVFKIVVSGGQILNPNPQFETFATFPEERDKFLNLLKDEEINGVIFFSGDIHSSQITKMDRDESYPLYEFTISPLTAGVYPAREDGNPWRLDGYQTNDRNFGFFSVTGDKKNRVLTSTNFNKDGEELWKFSINENDLK